MSKQFEFLDDTGHPYPEWETKKLKELSEFVSDGDWIESKDQSKDGIRILQTGNVGQGSFRDKESNARFISPKRAEELNCVFLEAKDILVSRLPDPAGRACFVPENLKGSVTVVDCAIIRVNDLVNSEFLLQLMQSDDYYTQVNKSLSGSTRKRISRSNLELIKFPIPSLAEQQKIAEFFSALDERIALTADKVKLLKEQKQGYLQKVFAQEIVFTDDNGDRYPEWEKKKLGELYRMASGMPFKGEEYQADGEYSVITNANVQGNRYLDMSSASHISEMPERIKPHQILKQGDILISLDGNVGRVSMVQGGKLLLAQRVGLLQPKSNQVLDNDFLYICLANDKFKDEMLSKQQGGGLKHIYARDVEGFEISVPSLSEQKKIGSFFGALDEQIELTENKLTLLKEQKKGYLQGVFG